MKIIPWIAMFVAVWVVAWAWYATFVLHWAFVTLAVPVTALAIALGILMFSED